MTASGVIPCIYSFLLPKKGHKKYGFAVEDDEDGEEFEDKGQDEGGDEASDDDDDDDDDY